MMGYSLPVILLCYNASFFASLHKHWLWTGYKDAISSRAWRFILLGPPQNQSFQFLIGTSTCNLSHFQQINCRIVISKLPNGESYNICPDKSFMTFHLLLCISISQSLKILIINPSKTIAFITNSQKAICLKHKVQLRKNLPEWYDICFSDYWRNYACFALRVKTANLELKMPLFFNLCHDWMQ